MMLALSARESSTNTFCLEGPRLTFAVRSGMNLLTNVVPMQSLAIESMKLVLVVLIARGSEGCGIEALTEMV